MSKILEQLMGVIEKRKINPPPNSYTARLLAGGVSKIGAKILEEAQEVVEAAGEPGETGRRHLIYESVRPDLSPAGHARPSRHPA